MSDRMVRALAYDGWVRVSAVVCTDAVEEARKRHNASPTAIAALGRTMASGLLLSWGLKGEGSVSLRVLGDGPLGAVIVTCNAEHQVRGYVQEPQVDLPLKPDGKLDVGGAIGAGQLSIAKDIGLDEAYTGSVPLVSGEIGDDVANYLASSEQTASIVSVGVLVDTDYRVIAAGGLILQAMPYAPDEIIDDLEEKLKSAQAVTKLITGGADEKSIIESYLPGVDIKFLETYPIEWKCTCNRDRISGVLKNVGKTELQDILEHEGSTEVTCHFCNEHYVFEAEDLRALITELEQDEAE